MRKLILLAPVFYLVLQSCTKDIVATDITKQTVNILAPGDGVSTPNNSITFWWDAIEHVDKYELQIVSPTFASVAALVADTSVTSNKFTIVLNPGSYQWRIRATNNAGSTAYSMRSFTIDTTSNLSYITVGLSAPADSLYTNVQSQTLSWMSVQNATQYRVEILNSGGSTVTSTVTTGTSLTYSFTGEDTYTWKVRAENLYSNSTYSSRAIIIDLSAPGVPVQLYPVSNSTLTLNDSLKWTGGAGADHDSLFVATDSLYGAGSVIVKQKISVKFYQVTAASGFISGTDYYWRLNSTDKAGNASAYTNSRRFTAN